MIDLVGGLWVLTALIVALVARRRGGRTLDFFFLSLILTPLTALIALAALDRKDPDASTEKSD